MRNDCMLLWQDKNNQWAGILRDHGMTLVGHRADSIDDVRAIMDNIPAPEKIITNPAPIDACERRYAEWLEEVTADAIGGGGVGGNGLLSTSCPTV